MRAKKEKEMRHNTFKRFRAKSDGYNTRVPTEVDGHRFDSAGEAGRYNELKLLEKTGAIRRLEVKPRLPLEISGDPVTPRGLTPDFTYIEALDPETQFGTPSSNNIDPSKMSIDVKPLVVRVYEDYKGYKVTREFKIKWRLAELLYPECVFRLVGPGVSR